ncbi:MAG: hypothetical protein HN742_38125 [Lentisphaerae bacterium]|jgi:hypothetical protein|nr:hypothetical protein [Lentisphaerota bacterium]MBT4821800.1 hypothetical protein [Lentisphaerota bacterium]MBT5604975.1 hypothetical protein [Lentisphaerota bacterium]MBT7055415.1 hypothetical protein [Lentisphaerota bacterium]MBT7847747.1 hypothetical protein [Lentisphaerota bacterium]
MTERDDNPIDLGQYVLGLDNSVLREVAANACGCSVANVRAETEPLAWSTYGCFTGDKVILTLSYKTTAGDSGETAVYVKRQLRDPGHMETAHYQYLNSNEIPVPRFYSSHLDEEGLEVLFLENAEPNRDGNRILKDPENYHAFLSIAARVNGLTPEGQYGESLFYFGPRAETIDRGRLAVSALWDSATSGRLGNSMKELCTSEHHNALLTMADFLSEIVPAMERGYTIDDFTPVKIGRRRDTGEMLVCDFRTTGLGLRFADAASWTGCPDYAQKAGYKRRELADYYFSEYLAAGGNEVPFETLLEETHTLWQLGVLCGLSWWLDSHFKGHHSMEDAEWQAVCRERLETDLTNLLKSQTVGKNG